MSRRRRWIAVGLALGLAIAVGVAWLNLAGIARWLVLRQIQAATGRTATVERFDLDLRRGHLRIAGLRLADREPGPPLAEIALVEVRFAPSALLRGRFQVHEAVVRGPEVRIVRQRGGELNIADVLAREATGERPAAVAVGRLDLTGGVVTLEDRTLASPRTWRAEGIAIEAASLSTEEHGPRGTVRLSATVAGAPVTAHVTELQLIPLHLKIQVSLREVDATLAQTFLAADAPVVIDGAVLTMSLAGAVDAREGTRVEGQGQVASATVRRRGTDVPAASMPALAFSFRGSEGAGGAFRLDHAEATGTAALFDTRTAPATRYDIDQVRLLVERPDEAPARVSLTAGLPGGGALDVQGTAQLTPPGASLRVQVARLDLAPWEALVPLPVRVGGIVESDLAVEIGAGGLTAARIRGRGAVSRALVTHGGVPLAGAERVEVTDVDADWPRLRAGRVRVVRPTAQLQRDATGRLSILDLAGPPAAAPEASASPPAAPGPALSVEIAEVAVEDATVTLDDAAVAPPVRLRIFPLRLTARDVTWPGARPARVRLTTATPGAGTLDVDGTVALDAARVDVRVRLAGAALAPYMAYAPLAAKITGRIDADLTVAGSLGPRPDVGIRGAIGVSDLAIADGDRPLLTVARIETRGLEYRWPVTAKIDQFHVRKSWAMVERRPDGTFPLAAIFARVLRQDTPGPSAPATPGASAPGVGPSIAIRESILEDGAAVVVDGAVSPAARFEIAGSRLVAHDFAWPARAPVAVELRAPIQGGGTVSAAGQLAIEPVAVDLKIQIEAVDIGPVRPYLPVHGRLAGKASGTLQLNAALEPLAISARGTAALADVALADGDRRLVTAARVEATGLSYTWPSSVKADRLRADKPWALLERRPDGTLPLLALFAAAPAPRSSPQAEAPAAGPPGPAAIDVAVGEAVLQNGAATIVDGTVSPAARLDIAGIRLVARDVAWPARAPMPVRLRASVAGGGTVRGTGQVVPEPAALDLAMVLDAVDLAAAQPYLPLRGRLAGKASGTLQVKAALQPLAITARGTATLADLAIADGDRPVITAAQVETTGLAYAWPATIAIDRMRIQKAWTMLERRADGTMPLSSLLAPARAAPAAAPARGSADGAPARPPLELSVRRAVLEDTGVTIVDGAVNPPARLEIAGGRLALSDLVWPARGPVAVELRAPMPGGGRVEARGPVRLDTSSVDLAIVLSGVDVGSARSYLQEKWTAAGTVDADLRVKGTLTPLAVSASGRVGLADLALGDGQRTLVSAKGVDLAQLSADWPRRIGVERIVLREPWALLERNPDGSLPLLGLIRSGPPGDMSAPAARPAGADRTAAPAERPLIEVRALTVENGFVRFVDGTTSPRFVEEASRIAVTVAGIDSAPTTRSPVSARGQLSGGAPFDLSGEIGPLQGPLFVDVSGTLSGFPLTRANPYSSRVLGWIARRGDLGATIRYQVRGDRLEAQNDVVMGQPEYVPSRRGDEVREKIGLPFDLLISLLKNARGEVRLAVPVTGSISAGELDFSETIWDGIRKAAISVLALPVSWIGKIFYTADSRIDTIQIWPVAFEPGSTKVRRDLEGQAERLATFLRDAPSVALEMKPIATLEDVDALKREAVREEIEARARDAGQPAAEVAARLLGERMPERPAPADLEAIVTELARSQPVPQAALDALATRRMDLVHERASARGVGADRLRASAGVVPVEASGSGRVEFEILR
ncbi:MAG TPA: DUF748 domain-containing protein [Candidatus Binatia bacterium]|nr:DUF748 domain-containing protein [Candidatus Binatia bacterium]